MLSREMDNELRCEDCGLPYKEFPVDYIQLLVPRSDESLQELGRLSRNIKLLAGELGITIVILSHRMVKNVKWK